MVADAAAAQASYDAAPAENAAKAAAAEVAIEPTLRVSRLAPTSSTVSGAGGLLSLGVQLASQCTPPQLAGCCFGIS